MVHDARLDAEIVNPTDKSMSSLELFDQWRSLFERSTLGVAMIRVREYRFLAANPAFLTMFGYSSRGTAAAIVPRHLY